MAEKPCSAEPLPWNKKWEDRNLQSSSGNRWVVPAPSGAALNLQSLPWLLLVSVLHFWLVLCCSRKKNGFAGHWNSQALTALDPEMELPPATMAKKLLPNLLQNCSGLWNAISWRPVPGIFPWRERKEDICLSLPSPQATVLASQWGIRTPCFCCLSLTGTSGQPPPQTQDKTPWFCFRFPGLNVVILSRLP